MCCAHCTDSSSGSYWLPPHLTPKPLRCTGASAQRFTPPPSTALHSTSTPLFTPLSTSLPPTPSPAPSCTAGLGRARLQCEALYSSLLTSAYPVTSAVRPILAMSKLEQRPREMYGRRAAHSSSSSSSRPGGAGRKGALGGLSEEQVEEVKEAFQLFDSNKSGSIDLRELKAAMRALGLDVSKEEMKVALAQLNKDPSSASAASLSITLDDFLSLMSTRMPARDSREEVEKVFRLFDEDGSGFITFRSLKKICNDLGEGLTEEEMQEMIDEADRDQDGKISFEEFFRIMKKRGDNPLDDWDSDED